MDTKTRKQEARDLLALEELSGGQADQLTILTAQQLGYEVRKTRTIPNPDGDIDVYGLFLNGEHVAGDDAWEANLWAEVPDYAWSVDACLMLPLPELCIWKLYYVDATRATAHVLFRPIGKPAGDMAFGQDETLPLAMLKAWWGIQSDEGKSA